MSEERERPIVARAIGWFVDLIYIAPVRRYISPTIWRYLVCGVGNYIIFDAVLYFLIYHYIVAERYLNLLIVSVSPHTLSLLILFPITFFTGFFFNRYVAFVATTRPVGKQLVRYALSIVGSVIVSYIILKVLVEGFGVWPTPAKVLSSCLTSLYSYLMARFYTFRR